MDRPLPQWHPPPVSTWLQGAETILGWLLPYRVFSSFSDTTVIAAGSLLLLILFIGLILASNKVFHSFSNSNRPFSILWFLTLINLIVYIGLILVTVLFLDRLTPLNDRILSPIFLLAFILLLAAVSLFLSARKKPTIRVVLIGFFLLFLYRGIQTIRSQREFGLGLSTPHWHKSQALEYLRSLPPVPIYTNDIPAIYFHADRMAHFIPVKLNPAEGTMRQDYPGELQTMRQTLGDGNGILILFGTDPEARLHSADLSDLLVGLEEVTRFDDAIVFRTASTD
jgi:hypothetical protein